MLREDKIHCFSIGQVAYGRYTDASIRNVFQKQTVHDCNSSNKHLAG